MVQPVEHEELEPPSRRTPCEEARRNDPGVVEQHHVIAVEEAAAARGIPIRGSSFALEGFGRVGSIASQMLAERGATLVAASNRRGSLHAPSGIDVAAAVAARETHADNWIERWEGAGTVSADPSTPLIADVDILIPAARSLSITSTAVASRRRTRAALSAAPRRHNSVMSFSDSRMPPLYGSLKSSG